MSTKHADETDLTFQAAITLDTNGDDPVVNVATPQQVNRFSVRDIWTGHRTLLVRLVVAIFFILLITLLETLLPGKSGVIARMLSIDAPENGTRAGGK
jgi:Fe2+ transport system protein B